MKMDKERKYGKFKRFINGLLKNGRYTFSRSELQRELGLEPDSLSVLISRSKQEGIIASPVKGFFVYVPPEYSSLGCLPAADFIHQLMKYWNDDYYVGLLSAAAVYGAAHHQPQAYQVMTTKGHRPIKVGAVRIVFYKSKNVGILPVLNKNTNTGVIKVGSPETTAFDLVTKISDAGGMGNLSTVLLELSERLSKRALVAVAKILDRTQYIQKLGFILDELGYSHLTESLHKMVTHKTTKFIPLISTKSIMECERNLKWKIIVNESVEAET
jgi:predicted transcriptional regulator of viral defense system